MEFLTESRWSPYLVGMGIGILSWFTFLVSRKAVGCSTAFARTSGMIEKLFRGGKVEQKPYYKEFKPVIEWEWMLVAGIVIGSFISSVVSGGFHWQMIPSTWAEVFGSDPYLRIPVAVLGGIFLGFGARWAGGCTSGHGISGTMQLAVSSWIAAICFFIGGIATAFLLYNVIGGAV